MKRIITVTCRLQQQSCLYAPVREMQSLQIGLELVTMERNSGSCDYQKA